jgi:ribosomal protein S20
MNKNHRITVYADSGRVSLKTIYKIAEEHLESGNKKSASKAIDEYEREINKEYQKNCDAIKKFRNRLKSQYSADDYKRDLIKD